MRFIIPALSLAVCVAVHGSPFAKGVTKDISPSASAPKGCSAQHSVIFGIAVRTIGPNVNKRGLLSRASPIKHSRLEASQHPTFLAPVSQIEDGQVRAPTMPIVTQISDGQIQVPTAPVVPIVTQISDGQVQAPTQSLVTVTTSSTATVSKASVSKTKGQKISARTAASVLKPIKTSAAMVPASLASALLGAADLTGSSSELASNACNVKGILELRLKHGVLLDSANRTGYIASNFQFQFDDPPQSGSIYTSGFAVCDNGNIALGASTVWWQCLSGDFYNLYDRYWAPQCNPIELAIVEIIDC